MRLFATYLILLTKFAFISYGAMLPHQGRVLISGSAYEGTGLFRFALVDQSGAVVWNHEGGVGDPQNSLSIPVEKGFYQCRLGDTSIDGMAPLPDTIFTPNNPLKLRIWFDDGTNGLQRLGQDQNLMTAPYAMTSPRSESEKIAMRFADEIIRQAGTSDISVDELIERISSFAQQATKQGTITKEMLPADIFAEMNKTVQMFNDSQSMISDLNRTLNQAVIAINRPITREMLPDDLLQDVNQTKMKYEDSFRLIGDINKTLTLLGQVVDLPITKDMLPEDLFNEMNKTVQMFYNSESMIADLNRTLNQALVAINRPLTTDMLPDDLVYDINQTKIKYEDSQRLIYDLNGSLTLLKQMVERPITRDMLPESVRNDLNRTITKSMLGADVLADLNRSHVGTDGQIAAGSIGITKLDPVIIKYLRPEIVSQTTLDSLGYVYQGKNISLSLNAEGKFITYQWQKDGINLEGETASNLNLGSFTPLTQNGTYRAIVANDFGSVLSEPVTLFRPVNPEGLNSTAPLTIKENLPAGTFVGQFTANDPDDGNLTYNLEDGESPDHAFFRLESNGSLYSNATFDFEFNKPSYSLMVAVRDQDGGVMYEFFSVKVIDDEDENQARPAFVSENGDINLIALDLFMQNTNQKYTKSSNGDGMGERSYNSSWNILNHPRADNFSAFKDIAYADKSLEYSKIYYDSEWNEEEKARLQFFPENQLVSIIVSHSLGVSKVEETSVNIDSVDYDVRKFEITEHLNAEGHEEQGTIVVIDLLSDIKKVRTIWVSEEFGIVKWTELNTSADNDSSQSEELEYVFAREYGGYKVHDMFDILSAQNQYVDDNGEEINHMNYENFYWGSLDKSPGKKVYNSDANDYWNSPSYWSFSHSVYNPVQGDFYTTLEYNGTEAYTLDSDSFQADVFTIVLSRNLSGEEHGGPANDAFSEKRTIEIWASDEHGLIKFKESAKSASDYGSGLGSVDLDAVNSLYTINHSSTYFEIEGLNEVLEEPNQPNSPEFVLPNEELDLRALDEFMKSENHQYKKQANGETVAEVSYDSSWDISRDRRADKYPSFNGVIQSYSPMQYNEISADDPNGYNDILHSDIQGPFTGFLVHDDRTLSTRQKEDEVIEINGVEYSAYVYELKEVIVFESEAGPVIDETTGEEFPFDSDGDGIPDSITDYYEDRTRTLWVNKEKGLLKWTEENILYSETYGLGSYSDPHIDETFSYQLILDSSGQPNQPSTHTVDLNSSVNLEMIWVEPGTFIMGEEGYNTVHEVSLTKGFYLGKYELTNAQYEVVMGLLPQDANTTGRGNYPVEKLSWEDAREFLDQLTLLEREANRLPEGWIYDFPTEAQWEYACRAGTTTAFYYGDKMDYSLSWSRYSDNGSIPTDQIEVGSYPANPWGFYDMIGNVHEWTGDWYESYPTGPSVDPTGPESGTLRVARGGSAGSSDHYSRSSTRHRKEPTEGLGLRIALRQE